MSDVVDTSESGPIMQSIKYAMATKDQSDFAVLAGSGSLLLAGLMGGCDGAIISASILPHRLPPSLIALCRPWQSEIRGDDSHLQSLPPGKDDRGKRGAAEDSGAQRGHHCAIWRSSAQGLSVLSVPCRLFVDIPFDSRKYWVSLVSLLAHRGRRSYP